MRGHQDHRGDRLHREDEGQPEAVQGPRAARVALERAKQEQRREDPGREDERVRARLLRPLHDERACGEEEATDECDPPFEELPGQDDEKAAREHRREDRREAKRPLGVSRDERPRLEEEVVQPVVLVDRAEEVLAHRLGGEGLVDPERRGREPDEPEREGKAAHDDDVDRERARTRTAERLGRDRCLR